MKFFFYIWSLFLVTTLSLSGMQNNWREELKKQNEEYNKRIASESTLREELLNAWQKEDRNDRVKQYQNLIRQNDELLKKNVKPTELPGLMPHFQSRANPNVWRDEIQREIENYKNTIKGQYSSNPAIEKLKTPYQIEMRNKTIAALEEKIREKEELLKKGIAPVIIPQPKPAAPFSMPGRYELTFFNESNDKPAEIFINNGSNNWKLFIVAPGQVQTVGVENWDKINPDTVLATVTYPLRAHDVRASEYAPKKVLIINAL